MSLQAVFFDFDGLIVDTESPEVEIWQEVFIEQGLVFPDESWIFSIGRGADQIKERPIQLLARLARRDLDLPSIEKDYRRRVMERIEAQPVLPGVVNLAIEAKQAGLIVWIVSSSRHDWVDGHLARLGIANLFDRTICREEAARAKPFPDLYLTASEIAGVEPRFAVALEDSSNGLTAANEAGLMTVAVPNKMTRLLDLSHADHRVESLADLTVELLQQWTVVP